MEDDFHRFAVVVHHDGAKVVDVAGDGTRYPWTTCPSAVEPLRALAGAPLSTRLSSLGDHAPARQNCTHLFDLAGSPSPMPRAATAALAPTTWRSPIATASTRTRSCGATASCCCAGTWPDGCSSGHRPSMASPTRRFHRVGRGEPRRRHGRGRQHPAARLRHQLRSHDGPRRLRDRGHARRSGAGDVLLVPTRDDRTCGAREGPDSRLHERCRCAAPISLNELRPSTARDDVRGATHHRVDDATRRRRSCPRRHEWSSR